jgi:hypothetical protein
VKFVKAVRMSVKSVRAHEKAIRVLVEAVTVLVYTEKNAIFRKMLILLKIISKIFICFSKLLFERVQILFFFVTN